ncbi:MAG TPA: NAD-binding protein [Ktedonobacterales bacterium]
MPAHERIRVIIVGAGHLGAWLAVLLDEQGYQVTIIAPNDEEFERLGSHFQGTTIRGNGSETETLELAKIQQAHVVVAVTNHDTKNLLISQLAQHQYQVPLVLCGLENPEYAEVFQARGILIITRTAIEVPRYLEAFSFN